MFASKAQMKEIGRLKKRADFLRVQKKGQKWVSKSLILQLAPREGVSEKEQSRFGITVTRRLDKSAVQRNRIKRRLKAAAYDIFPLYAKKNVDYILIGRHMTKTCSYIDLQKDLKWCLKRLGYLEKNKGDNK